MIEYEGRVFRPPSEAYSLIVQVTIGCSHNKCTFCDMYKEKRFRVRKLEEVKAELAAGTLKVFDTATEGFITVEGAKLDSYLADVDTDANFTPDTEAVADGYFHESEYRSAPYFDLRIDGITFLNEKY